MKILFCDRKSDLRYGSHQNMATLCDKLKNRGHRVSAVIDSKNFFFEELTKMGIDVTVQPHSSFEDIPPVLRLLKNHNPDVIWMNNICPTYFSFLISKVLRIPVVLSLWTADFGLTDNISVVLSDSVVVPSKHFLLSLPSAVRDKSYIVWNAVDTKKFSIKSRNKFRGRIRERLGIPKDAIVVGAIIIYQKVIDPILEVIKRTEEEDLYFLIVSDRPDKLKSSIISKKVFFIEPMFHIEEVFSEFDIYLSLEFFKHSGRSIAEAMCMGIPTVASSSGISTEMIENGTTGFLYEHGNYASAAEKVRLLLHNKKARADIGLKSFKFAKERFCSEKNSNTVEKILEKTIVSKRRK